MMSFAIMMYSGEMTGQLETPEVKPCLKSRYRLPEIDYPTYSKIPGCLQKQFSFKQVNFLIEETNTYLNTREKGRMCCYFFTC